MDTKKIIYSYKFLIKSNVKSKTAKFKTKAHLHEYSWTRWSSSQEIFFQHVQTISNNIHYNYYYSQQVINSSFPHPFSQAQSHLTSCTTSR